MIIKNKTYLKKISVSVLLFGLFFAIGIGVGEAVHLFIPANGQSGQAPGVMIKGTRTNILILGVDARPGQTDTQSRTDSMLLVSLDPDLKKIAVISIPRDTLVTIKGNKEKINAANEYGGPQLAAQMVGELLSTKVDYYLEMNFNGFKDIIDTLGGVNINIAQRMYKPSENIDLNPGLQRLNGTQALGYVRFRSYVYGDIQRTEQQQVFLKALAQELLQPKTIARLPQLASEVYNNVTTNLSLTDMAKLAACAPAFSPDAMISQTLPGTFYADYLSDGSSASYWKVDQRLAAQVLDNLYAGHTLAVIEGEASSLPKIEPKLPAASQKIPSSPPESTASESKKKASSTPTTVASTVQQNPVDTVDSRSTPQQKGTPPLADKEQQSKNHQTAQPNTKQQVESGPIQKPIL